MPTTRSHAFATRTRCAEAEEKYHYQIMASSKRKMRNRSTKKRIIGRISHPNTHCRVRSTRHKRANTPYQRQPYNSISIPQLVYELLTIDKYNQEAKRFPSPEHFETSPRRMQKSREQQRLLYKAVDHRDSSESMQMPEYTIESRPTFIDSLMEATDAANSSAPTSSANSSVSNVSIEPITLTNSLNSARALFRKRSLVRLINNYINAGVEEGKRQAKKYIRKALSFGVRSGYLIPSDRQGNMLRVCPTLDIQSWSWRRADTDCESRQRRRIARRGKTRLTTIADRKAMRRGIPQGKSLHNIDNGWIASKRRYRTQLAQNPARSLSRETRESSTRKSPGKSLRERSKPKVFVRKNNKINNTISNKRGQQRKRDGDNRGDMKKPIKKCRTSLAKRAENNHEPVEENYKDVSGRDRDQYKSNEDSYRAERRKFTSSQEDGSRMEKRKTEANINDNRIDCDRIESRNSNDNNNDKKSETANVEHDMNGRATREMED